MILSYCKAKRVYQLPRVINTQSKAVNNENNNSNEDNSTGLSRHALALFRNENINRTASPSLVNDIFEEMLARSLTTPSASNANILTIWWCSRTEWADLVYSWADRQGFLDSASVCTVFEVFQSEDQQGEPFYAIPEDLWKAILQELVSKGRCQVFTLGSNDTGQPSIESGIKFLRR